MKYFSRTLESGLIASFLNLITWVALRKPEQKVHLKKEVYLCWDLQISLITVIHEFL